MYRHFHCTNSSCFYDSFCHAKYDQYVWLVSFQCKTVGIDKFLNSFADHSTVLLASRCATAGPACEKKGWITLKHIKIQTTIIIIYYSPAKAINQVLESSLT